jgi:hypothetical protein
MAQEATREAQATDTRIGAGSEVRLRMARCNASPGFRLMVCEEETRLATTGTVSPTPNGGQYVIPLSQEFVSGAGTRLSSISNLTAEPLVRVVS